MPWLPDAIPDASLLAAYRDVADLAEWSEWSPFATALAGAPRQPGVYLFRDPGTRRILYVGMAGERAGNGTSRPKGLYGRLTVYRTGKAAVSGFGEAALDRALADPAWITEQLHRLTTSGPRRAKTWAADAIDRISPEVSWSVCPEAVDARILEEQVVHLLRPWGLWNR